jgi:hypothetical protein
LERRIDGWFVLVDTQNQRNYFYKQSGATEYAQQSAEGKVQEKVIDFFTNSV